MIDTVGLILAAGKQTRFQGENSKTLVSIEEGLSVLDVNIENMIGHVNVIFVVINDEADSTPFEHIINQYRAGNKDVRLLKIHSGFGDAHAIMMSLDKIKSEHFENCIVCWGDSVQCFPQPIKAISKKIREGSPYGCMPVVFENKPYVKVCIDDQALVKEVQRSKHDEWDFKPGLHDMSIFGFNITLYREAYKEYSNQERDEYSFMEMISTSDKIKFEISMVGFYGCKAFAYNTIQEFEEQKGDILKCL